MLVSHKKHFIFTKTIKTASTSVEIFFQSECIAVAYKKLPGEQTDAIVSDAGIVGFRGGNPTGENFYNHMPAGEIKNQIGESRFNHYFKFCTIRNPFDKMVSAWWHFLPEEQRNVMKNKDFHFVRESFSKWILSGVWKLGKFSLNDRDKYFIGDDMVMDDFIKYEDIYRDINNISGKLKICKPIEELGRFKDNIRKIDTHFSEYYSDTTKSKVSEVFDWEIHSFNYSLFK